MLVHKPDRCDMYWEELRKNQQLIRNGRSLKGEKENFDKCYECFKIALEELWKLNAQIPSSPFWSHLFTLIVSIGSLIIGFLLSLLLKK
jgi:tetrahydromethanopterin S-methyltransferase subunit F